MMILQILLYLAVAFLGYAMGRISHVYWGYMNTPDHWIYGLVLMIGGVFFYHYLLGALAFWFGIGHFISDFKDFLDFKFFGPDKEGKRTFWGID